MTETSMKPPQGTAAGRGFSPTCLGRLKILDDGNVRLEFKHRVTYGPQPIAALDPEESWKFAHGIIEGQAALIRLEILLAAGKPEATGVKSAILERWPELAWWVEQVRNKSGLLARLRGSWGIDSSYAPRDKPHPYENVR